MIRREPVASSLRFLEFLRVGFEDELRSSIVAPVRGTWEFYETLGYLRRKRYSRERVIIVVVAAVVVVVVLAAVVVGITGILTGAQTSSEIGTRFGHH